MTLKKVYESIVEYVIIELRVHSPKEKKAYLKNELFQIQISSQSYFQRDHL